MRGFGRHTSKVIAYLRDQVGPPRWHGVSHGKKGNAGTHLRNNNGIRSRGVHPISPQQYDKNMSYIINVRDDFSRASTMQRAVLFYPRSRRVFFPAVNFSSSYYANLRATARSQAVPLPAMSTGNTIEGGLMEIKTPYRIPYVSQMAALDGVGYKHQPSLGLFMCFFLLGGSPRPSKKHHRTLSPQCGLRGTERSRQRDIEPVFRATSESKGKNTALMNYETYSSYIGGYRLYSRERAGAELRARARLISQSKPKNSARAPAYVRRGEAVLRCGRL
ncbi:hypothetical protein X777_09557 [Ooceraea biroi]|uniref:Uncharacterized protein n=1 Tax=Ooceraea biroi TaxID=2015173 RepID=A0A026W6W4_OOCBI|nr:hypothetical protein X777_09557 [Ooceraea biroi]